MTTSNKELEQIAKQVSLLNRLIELLRMQEEPMDESLEELGTFTYMPNRMAYSECRSYMCAKDDVDFTFEQAWNHPVTQKAWSDELVKVAGELNKTRNGLTASVLYEICEALGGSCSYYMKSSDAVSIILEATLKKYGRSLYI